MKVVVDSAIPFIKGVLEPYASVVYLKGSEISKSDVMDAQGLIIRTRTKCTSDFLSGSDIKFIASATIGKDHVDLEFCKRNNILFTNAAGCNSMGVVQYVLTALFSIKGFDLQGKTIGIVGAGNIGERLARLAPAFGYNVLRCDPPLENAIKSNSSVFKDDSLRNDLKPDDYFSLDYVLANSHIVTLHVPFEKSTANMANDSFFGSMQNGSIFINASRGEVVDEESLLHFRNKFAAVILDVWQGEPLINRYLLDVASIATPHIAGYSLEGKINATVMVVNSFGNFFNIGELSNFKIGYPLAPELPLVNDTGFLLREFFPIFETDSLLKGNPDLFEQIRNDYQYRREIPESLIEFVKKR